MQIPLLADFANVQPLRFAKVSAIFRIAIIDGEMLRNGNRSVWKGHVGQLLAAGG
jgi:hypothetical protein